MNCKERRGSCREIEYKARPYFRNQIEGSRQWGHLKRNGYMNTKHKELRMNTPELIRHSHFILNNPKILREVKDRLNNKYFKKDFPYTIEFYLDVMKIAGFTL